LRGEYAPRKVGKKLKALNMKNKTTPENESRASPVSGSVGPTGSAVTAAYIDLATYDTIDKYCYGGSNAVNPFQTEVTKSIWFAQIPAKLPIEGPSGAFGGEISALISPSQGDYLLHAWIRVTIPGVTLAVTEQTGPNCRLRWTRNLMHNLIEEISFTFNDLVADQFSSSALDFWNAFNMPDGKKEGYDNMIGNIDELTFGGTTLPQITLNLPLPLFFSRNGSAGLPVGALFNNDIKINVKFRNWSELLIISDPSAPNGTPPSRTVSLADLDGGVAPELKLVEVWGNFANVSNEERAKMRSAPIDLLIDQFQETPRRSWDGNSDILTEDLRFSDSIKALFFGFRNSTIKPELSNYTAASPVTGSGGTNFNPIGAMDPIKACGIYYEDTTSLGLEMDVDYFSLIKPWYNATSIPAETGYHFYSYSLNPFNGNPLGSTNFSKLSKVTLNLTMSEGAITGANGTGMIGSGADYPQTFELIVVALNWNIVRISGGALGFPIL
jgi:hypothetical protein